MTNQSLELLPEELAHLDGTEEITPDTTVRDFWAWALGDLRLNSTRGLFAEFLVAKAVGDTRKFDDGWGAYDVRAEFGAKIEVKTSAYLQSWKQTKLSNILFSGLITHRRSETEGYFGTQSVIADIYVFCVQTCKDPKAYDPLEIEQWDFYVMSGEVVRQRNQKSMALSTVRLLAGDPIRWNLLGETIHTTFASTQQNQSI